MILGVDIGGTKSSIILGDKSGTLVDVQTFPSLTAKGPEYLLGVCEKRIASILNDNIDTIGVSIGGPLNSAEGIILGPPHLPGWDNVYLKKRWEALYQKPVVVTHDAAACAYAEYLWGAGRGTSSLVYLTCGTGFGAGIILNGKPLFGYDSYPSEIGHWQIREDGPIGYGKKGSAEAFCSGTGLRLLAEWMFPQRWSFDSIEGRELCELWVAGDPDATQVIHENAKATGDVCALVGDLICPDRILLGSLSQHLGERWVRLVVDQFQKQARPKVRENCEVLPAGLGEDLQPLSAIASALV